MDSVGVLVSHEVAGSIFVCDDMCEGGNGSWSGLFSEMGFARKFNWFWCVKGVGGKKLLTVIEDLIILG